MRGVVLVLLMVGLVVADLPVHCVKHQVVGKWKLLLGEAQQHGTGMLTCGHEIPDRPETSYKAGRDFKENVDLLVTLDGENQVREEGSSSTGQWTMVYDEGFEITHKNMKFFAFSKYEPKQGADRDYQSMCGETLVGWYNNIESGERGCYRAVKVGEKVEATDLGYEQVSVVQPEFMKDMDKLKGDDGTDDDPYSSSFLQDYKDPILLQTKVRLHQDFSDHQRVVEHLNTNVEKTWTAKVHPEFEGKSIKELNQMAGRRKFHQGNREVFAQVSATYSGSSNSDLPSSFSYAQYLGEARQQQQCGSCYTISTMSMLSARLKMQGEMVDLSPQYSVDCNYYNQGCDGGYPFLVSKFFSENYLTTELNYPYKGITGECKKVSHEGDQKVYQVKNYRYIGGAYGLSNERAIMEEIYNNGPVILNFEPTYDFMSYSGGIYHSLKDSDYDNHGYSRPEWEKVDHSVLCFGWGEENGQKFWLLQNSWGSNWGENGNFRMLRGVDESAIESMAEAADPVILGHKNGAFIEQSSHDGHAYSFVAQKMNLKYRD